MSKVGTHWENTEGICCSNDSFTDVTVFVKNVCCRSATFCLRFSSFEFVRHEEGQNHLSFQGSILCTVLSVSAGAFISSRTVPTTSVLCVNSKELDLLYETKKLNVPWCMPTSSIGAAKASASLRKYSSSCFFAILLYQYETS